MIKLIIITIIILIFIFVFFPIGLWKLHPDNGKKDLPWNGKNSKVTLEYKSVSDFSTTGSTSYYRWTSPKIKRSPRHYGNQIDDYFKKIGLLEEWPVSNSYSVNNALKTTRHIKAPYDIYFVSVEPVLAFLLPKIKPKSYRSNLVTSQYLTNFFYYATEFNFYPDILWFSPQLNQKPEKLILSKGAKIKLIINQTEFIIEENNGLVTIVRNN